MLNERIHNVNENVQQIEFNYSTFIKCCETKIKIYDYVMVRTFFAKLTRFSHTTLQTLRDLVRDLDLENALFTGIIK
jgi:hypothetical protein